MTILFTCPHCGTQTDVFDEYAGQSGPCVICGKTITVPYPCTASAAERPVEKRSDAPAAALRRRSGLLPIIAVVGGGLAAFAGLLFLLFSFVFPAVAAARSAGHRARCAKNVERIALAMLQYEADYGCFPPAYVADKTGQRLHSWRVLLLPYLGYRHVYERYDFRESWNGPHNAALRTMMPEEYGCPADPDAGPQDEANYMVLVGPATLFPGPQTVRRSQVTDGLPQTILLVETPAAGVCWMEPKDLDAGNMQFRLQSQYGNEIGSHHPGGAHVATADGRSHFLSDQTAPDQIQALTTIQGGELIPWDALDD